MFIYRLNEIGKDHDDHSKTTPKTIRERFIAARERRREEKEKKKVRTQRN